MIQGHSNRPWGISTGPSFVLALAVAVFVSIASLPSAFAQARTGLKVLLIIERTNDPLMARIQAEISAQGLTVVTSGPTGPLENSARQQQAVAAVRALPSRNGVEVWMADATTGRTLTRQMVVDERPEGPDYTLVAMQTAELLRTGLFPKKEKAEAPPATPVVMTVTATPETPARTGEWRFQGGLGGLNSLGGVDTAMQSWLTAQRWWRRDLGVGLAFPLRRSPAAARAGSSRSPGPVPCRAAAAGPASRRAARRGRARRRSPRADDSIEIRSAVQTPSVAVDPARAALHGVRTSSPSVGRNRNGDRDHRGRDEQRRRPQPGAVAHPAARSRLLEAVRDEHLAAGGGST